MTPGATAFTRMPNGISSLAMPRVTLWTKALEEPYNPAPPLAPLRAAIEVVLMMKPPPAAFRCAIAACEATITERAFRSMISS